MRHLRRTHESSDDDDWLADRGFAFAAIDPMRSPARLFRARGTRGSSELW